MQPSWFRVVTSDRESQKSTLRLTKRILKRTPKLQVYYFISTPDGCNMNEIYSRVEQGRSKKPNKLVD